MFHHTQIFFFFLGTKENVFAGLFYPLFPQASWKIILTLLRLWIKLHKFADFIRQFGSDSNLKHLTRLPPLSAVHMVHLAYIVLRSELMTLWAVGPALFDWLLLQLWGRQLQCVEEQGTHSRASWKTNRRGGKDQVHGISKYSTNHQETNWMATKRFLSRVLCS